MSILVEDNPARSRYELTVDGAVAGIAEYHLSASRITLVHTEVDDAYEGQGLAGMLAKAVLTAARDAGLSVIPKCPYVRGYLARHPEYVDLVPEERREEFGL